MTLILSGVKDVASISKGPQSLWLNSVNVIPLNHLCVETDTGFSKLGNGNDIYADLAYIAHDCTAREGEEDQEPLKVKISCIDTQLMGINFCEEGILEPPPPPTLGGRLEEFDSITGGPESPQEDDILTIITIDSEPDRDIRAVVEADVDPSRV